MEPLIPIVVAVLTGATALSVALLGARREREDSADAAVEQVLRERLAFKDEQLAELRRALARCEGREADE